MRRVLFVLIMSVSLMAFAAAGQAADQDQVIAYYFHTTFRCPSCQKIQRYAEAAWQEYFAPELESGALVTRVINVEEAGQGHYVQDYQLYTKSVVLALIKDGQEVRFKNLDQIWPLLGNKGKFYQYIKDETQRFLDDLPDGDKS